MSDNIPLDDGFIYGPTGELRRPHTFIQWKGTDVCMDFHCECGAHCHFDGDFAYVVKCPHCGTAWEMPCHVFPRKVDSRTYAFHVEDAKPLEPDEDYCDEAGNAVPVPEQAAGDEVEGQVRAPRATTGIPHPQEPYIPEPPKERT